MEETYEIIQKRHSIRTYTNEEIKSSDIKILEDFLKGNTQGPFGNTVTFKLVDVNETAADELKKYISYGNVKGGRFFIAGKVKKGAHAMEDFGYCMEKNVLLATSLGLGTVWLGGSLNRSAFAFKLDAKQDEVIPAVTPVGYPSDKRSFIDKVTLRLSGGKFRKEFGDIFFLDNLETHMTTEMCGKYAVVLEAVRLAPSASNKQPWRIIKEKDGNTFHFYMDEYIGNKAIKGIQIQNNDMGIAMSHFELMAKAYELEGSWQQAQPEREVGKLIYIVSWKG